MNILWKHTDLAKGRNSLAGIRTHLSNHRTNLAKQRTLLAFIRTGLALIALGISLIRYFGLGVWTIMDGLLIFSGVITMGISIRAYLATYREERNIIVISIKNYAPVKTTFLNQDVMVVVIA